MSEPRVTYLRLETVGPRTPAVVGAVLSLSAPGEPSPRV